MTAQTWTAAEAAEFLKVSEGQLRQLRRRGGGPPYIKIGRSVRYVPAQVGKWIQDTARTRTRSHSVGVIS